MRSSFLFKPCRSFRWTRVGLLVVLTMLFCNWSNCSGIIAFNSCPNIVPQPIIVALTPDTMSQGNGSDLLTVDGRDFVSQSQIMWNGHALQTTFVDSRHLQAMITNQTFSSFGGSLGGTVQISVRSQEPSAVAGCPNGLSSASLTLFIN